jgi:hypothetical protein
MDGHLGNGSAPLETCDAAEERRRRVPGYLEERRYANQRTKAAAMAAVATA